MPRLVHRLQRQRQLCVTIVIMDRKLEHSLVVVIIVLRTVLNMFRMVIPFTTITIIAQTEMCVRHLRQHLLIVRFQVGLIAPLAQPRLVVHKELSSNLEQ